MKVAINYSPQAAELVSEHAIPLDLFKCPPAWDQAVVDHCPTLLDDAKAHAPIYIHFPLYTAMGNLANVDWNEVENALSSTETAYVNIHLQARTDDHPELLADSSNDKDRDYLLDIFIRDVECVTQKFGPERVIAENVVYRGRDGRFLYLCADPSVITQVVLTTKCGFLLDTAHARLTCHVLGIEPQEYIKQLPLSRLKELHVTGAQWDVRNSKMRDSMPMGAEDWATIEWVIGRIKENIYPEPWVVTLEYGGIGPGFEWRSDPKVITEQLPRLYELAGSARKKS